jgi:bacterioferritin-associated ferredoxin
VTRARTRVNLLGRAPELKLTLIICNCFKVSDREIRLTIDLGAHDVDAVGDACGAGWGCGGCHETIEHMIAERILAAQTQGKSSDAE